MNLLRQGHPSQILALAGAASLLELGPIVALLLNGDSLTMMLVAGLAYQLGNGAPRLAVLDRRPVLAALSGIAIVCFVLAPLASVLWFASLAGLSWILQAIRRRLTIALGKDRPSTAMKRTARVAGFVAATMFPAAAWIGIGAAIVIGLLPDARHRAPVRVEGRRPPSVIELVMIIHQSHYFSYCYAIPVLLGAQAFGAGSLVGVWFACGWVSYLSAEALWRRLPPATAFIVGHVCLSATLATMALFSDTPWAVIGLWILSGFGGGTVYCLALLHKARTEPAESLERSEDVGHVLGVAIALLSIALLNWPVSSLPLIASVTAGLAAASMIAIAIQSRREGKLGTQAIITGGMNADR